MARKKKEIKKEIVIEKESILTDEEVKELKEDEIVDVISLNDKPVFKDVVEEKEEIPNGFVNIQQPKPNKPSILVHNGRVYIETSKNVGMYADNGEVFDLRSIK